MERGGYRNVGICRNCMVGVLGMSFFVVICRSLHLCFSALLTTIKPFLQQRPSIAWRHIPIRAPRSCFRKTRTWWRKPYPGTRASTQEHHHRHRRGGPQPSQRLDLSTDGCHLDSLPPLVKIQSARVVRIRSAPTRYRGLEKNTAQIKTLFMLSNLLMVRGKLMAGGA